MNIRNFALLGVLLASGGISYGQLILHGSFEESASQLTGWTVTGDVNVWTAANGINPTDGARQAEMSTSDTAGAVSAASLESFLNLSSGTLLAQGGGQPGTGSAIKQTITIGAGDVGKFLTFDWNLITANHTSSTERDYAFLTINGNAHFFKLADIQSPLMHDGNNRVFDRETGYQTFNGFQFTSQGDYTLGFGVVDVDTTAFANSGLVLDNIRLTAVPEPGQWTVLAGAGLLLFTAARRRLALRTV